MDRPPPGFVGLPGGAPGAPGAPAGAGSWPALGWRGRGGPPPARPAAGPPRAAAGPPRAAGAAGAGDAAAGVAVGDVVRGRVTHLARFGAFVALPGRMSGLVHISEIAHAFVTDVGAHVAPGDEVEVRVLSLARGKVALSMKQARRLKTGYERMVELGGDFGDAWDADGATEWADLGDRPDPSPHLWEEDPALFRRFDGGEADLPDLTNFHPFREEPPHDGEEREQGGQGEEEGGKQT